MTARFGLAFGLWAALAGLSRPNVAAAQTAYPPSTPFLRIETGMHTTIIKRIDVDAAERFLVTASGDKTARVWDLKTGTLLQIFRPPEGSGKEGPFTVSILGSNACEEDYIVCAVLCWPSCYCPYCGGFMNESNG